MQDSTAFSFRSYRRVAPLLLVVLTLFTFVRVINSDFTNWDDYYTVAHDPAMNPPNWHGLGQHWKHAEMDIYMPLTQTLWTGISCVAQLSSPDEKGVRLNPYPFHLANLLVHMAAVLLVYSLLRVLDCGAVAAAIGAAVFAVHSTQVEPVAWISGFKDVLCGMLCLLALRLWIAPISRIDRPHWRYALTCFIYALALLAKPSAVALPLIVASVALLVLRWSFAKTIVRSLPWIALAGVFAIVAQRSQPASSVSDVPVHLRPFVAADAIWFYLKKIVWPLRLGIDYGRNPPAVLSQKPLLLWVKLLALFIPLGFAVFLRRRFPAFLACLAIVISALLPVLGLVRFDFQEYSTVADHYLYFALLGPALLIASLVQRWPSRLTYKICALGIALLALQSVRQTANWKNATTLMTHAIEVNPTSWVGHLNLGIALTPAFPNEAIRQLTIARDLRPNNARSFNALASTLDSLGEFYDAANESSKAMVAYHASLQLNPNDPVALCNLAAILAEHAELDEAIDLYRRALRQNPDLAAAQTGLDNALRSKSGPTTERKR